MVQTIGNPLSWTAKVFGRGIRHLEEGTSELGGDDDTAIVIRHIGIEDLRFALRKGFEDFQELRSDAIFIVLIYPIIGVLLVLFASNADLLPMVFPMVSGFALLGPLAAVGLYEMSRRRELGLDTGWVHAFSVIGSPSFVPILVLGGYLVVLFTAWMLCANWIYALTLGPEAPVSLTAFVSDVLTTGTGWVMIIVGCFVGFVFAATVLATSVVSFPLLIDHHIGVPKAVVTSIRITRENPFTIAVWGAIVAGLLGIGMITMFLGLIIILPVLGHATWHLYRRAVASAPSKRTAQDHT
jgi:uncharacterized membrane protein